MRIFLAGIMQGSHLAARLHNQNYRARLRRLLEQHIEGVDVYDPLSDHSDSLDYDAARGRAVFMKHNRMCREVDVLIAFVPEASMGTAIEMWEAYQAENVVISISPLEHNWAIRFLSDEIFPDVEQFEHALATGRLGERIARLLKEKKEKGEQRK